jgi:tetratricopeptide (TPR) repeat protein
VLLVLAAVTLMGGCSSSSPPNATPPPTEPVRPAFRTVSLPDLSGMAQPVQRQLRDQFDALLRMEGTPATPPGERAAAYGEMGGLLMAAESYAAAEPFLLDALALQPADVRWNYYLAHLYRLQGHSQKAATFFERALEAKPDDLAVLVWLGTVYLDQGRVSEARPLFAKALALDPRAAAAHVGLGRVSLAVHDYPAAISELEAGLALDRGATSTHYLLATAYRAAGDTAKADAHLRQSGPLQVGPPDPLLQSIYQRLKSPVLYDTRGDRALARGEFGQAVSLFRSGLDLDPDSLARRQKLATALYLNGDVDGSIQQLQEILRRSPQFASAHYSLGVMALASGQPELAIDRFASAVRYDPTYIQARLQLANTLRQVGRFAPARDQYAAVIKQDSRLAEAQFGEAASLVGLRRYGEARERFIEGMRLHPERPEFLAALVRLYAAAPEARVRDGPRALALAQELVKRSDTPRTREAMAMALAETGQYEAAARWQREAIVAAARAGQSQLSRRMGEDLRSYERGQPSRVPWREEPMWES